MFRLLFAALCCGTLLSAQNLIKNPLMTPDKKGKVSPWIVVKGKVHSVAGRVELSSGPKDPGFLVFQKLNVQPDTDYLLEYEYRSSNGAGCRVYCEEMRKTPEGKMTYRSFSSGWPNAPEKWTKISIPVRLAPGWHSFYVAARNRKGGMLQIRNMVFKKGAARKGVMGGSWQVTAPHKLNKEETAVTVMGSKKPAVGINGIPVQAGREYRIEYLAHGKSASGNQSSSMHVYSFKISPELPGGILHQDLYQFGKQRKHHLFRVPAGSKVRQVNLSVAFSTPGTVEFSDFKITSAPIDTKADWRIETDLPFTSGIYAGKKVSNISGKLIADKNAVKADLSFNGQKTTLKFVNGSARFSLKAPEKMGKYDLEAVLYSKDGSKVLRKQLIRRVPAAANSVTADGKFIRINGQKFFPNGLWYGGDKALDEKKIAYLAANGVNSLWCSLWHYRRSSAVLMQMLNTAWKYKIRLLVGCGTPENMAQIAEFKKTVDKIYTPEVLKHPAFMGVFLSDEPLWLGYPYAPLQAAYQIFKDKMPHHIVFVNSAPRYEVEDLRPYSDASDIYGVDIYPIPYPSQHSGLADKMPSCVGKYALRMRQIVRDRKPVFVTLQGGSWHEWGSSGKPRYPTAGELRYMALDAITNGASGCKVWGFGKISYEPYTRTLMVMFREMHQLAPLIKNGRMLADLPVKTLRIVPFKHDKNTYFAALNPTEKKQTAQITLPEKADKVLFYLDNRSEKLSGGKVTITLDPYRAVVFGTAPLPKAAVLPPLPAVNPFAADCLAQYNLRNRERYAGKANWIWDPARITVNGKCRLATVFEVKDTSKPVKLLCAADDAATIWLNGFEVKKIMEWDKMRLLDLRKYLRHGKNLLVIEANDIAALPCGVLAELRVDGRKLYSDATWKTLPAEGKIPGKVPADFNKRPAAKIMAPYGSGAWGFKVKIIPED